MWSVTCERAGINDERGGLGILARGARLLGEPWIKINPSSVSCRTIPLVLLLAQPADSAGLKYFPSPRGNYLTPVYICPAATARAKDLRDAIESNRKRGRGTNARGVSFKICITARGVKITHAWKQSARKSGKSAIFICRNLISFMAQFVRTVITESMNMKQFQMTKQGKLDFKKYKHFFHSNINYQTSFLFTKCLTSYKLLLYYYSLYKIYNKFLPSETFCEEISRRRTHEWYVMLYFSFSWRERRLVSCCRTVCSIANSFVCFRRSLKLS